MVGSLSQVGLAAANAAMFVVAVLWLVGWLRGHNSVRDERGRLKPAPALAVSLALLVGVASLVALAVR